MGIKVLTVWAFSTENWDRSAEEIAYLMNLYEIMVDKHLKEALKDEVRIIHLGRKDRINEKLRNKILNAEEKTKHFDKAFLCVALDYGGRDEIVRAHEKANKAKINEADFSQFLDTKDLPYPNPDLIIRTGGEQRLSGFMLWQCQYSELMFIKKFLPDFKAKDFEECVSAYMERQRRFGK